MLNPHTVIMLMNAWALQLELGQVDHVIGAMRKAADNIEKDIEKDIQETK